MHPVSFPQQSVVYAKDQPQYKPLPACQLPAVEDESTPVCSCWKLSFWERLQVLFTGRVWVTLLTFNKPLQPLKLSSTIPGWVANFQRHHVDWPRSVTLSIDLSGRS